MPIVNLYDGIYKVLANDDTVLTYLGIGSGADNLTKAKHIQKRSKPQDPVDNLPIIAFYAPPGKREGSNLEVYTTPFIFSIYTKDDVDLAQRIADRLIYLFDGNIPRLDGVENFESTFSTGYEDETDLSNTYCFTVVFTFSITLSKE